MAIMAMVQDVGASIQKTRNI